MSPWRMGLPDFGSVIYHPALAGDYDSQQGSRICGDGVGCMGCSTQGTGTLIQPGKSVLNAFIESINGKFRDECLNEP